MFIVDASHQSIVLRRNRGSLAADFSSLDTKWMDVRAVEPSFDTEKVSGAVVDILNADLLIRERWDDLFALPKADLFITR